MSKSRRAGILGCPAQSGRSLTHPYISGLIGFDVETAWRYVRPELLRLLKRGTKTTANEQYAIAA